MNCGKCNFKMVRVPDVCLDQTSSSSGLNWNPATGETSFLWFNTRSGTACLLDPRNFVRFLDWLLILTAIGLFGYGLYLHCLGRTNTTPYYIGAVAALVIACVRMSWYKNKVDGIWAKTWYCPGCHEVSDGKTITSVWNYNKLFEG